MPCSTSRCSAAFTPSRWSAPPNCLLQERIPAPNAPTVEAAHGRAWDRPTARRDRARRSLLSRRLPRRTPRPADAPAVEQRYHVMVTNAGAGFSTCEGLDVTRWREDATRETWGQFCLRPRPAVGRGLVGRLPAGRPAADDYEVVFSRRQGSLSSPRRKSRPRWRSPSRPSSLPRSAGSR